MKKIVILLPLLFLLTISGCGQSSKKSSGGNGAALEDILRQKATNPKDVLGWLKKCADECHSPDKEIARDLSGGYQILFSIAEKTPVYSEMTMEQKAQALLGQSKVRSAFLKILQTKTDREILETAYRELVNPNSIYAAMDIDVAKALDETIERLKQSPSTTATAWYLRAISIPPSVDSVLDVMTAYKKCIEADRAQMQCQNAYRDLARFYERPRCRDNSFALGTQFFAAKVKKDSHHSKKVSIYGKDYFLAKNPTLAAEDLLEATLESLGPDQYEIWFSLKTFSNMKLSKFTEEGMKQKSSLVLSFGGKVLAEAPVLQVIKDGQFRMPFANSGQAQESFEKICNSITHDRVPEELRVPSN